MQSSTGRNNFLSSTIDSEAVLTDVSVSEEELMLLCSGNEEVCVFPFCSAVASNIGVRGGERDTKKEEPKYVACYCQKGLEAGPVLSSA